MSADPQDYLEDILESIRKIEEYVHDIDITGLQASSLIQDGVIRNFEIIGEAMGRLPEEFLIAHPELPIRDSISMRNFLIHQYDGVEVEYLWDTIQSNLPSLKAQVTELLAQIAK